MLSIIMLLAFNPGIHPNATLVGFVLLYIAAALTLWSMIMYLRAAWPDLSADIGGTGE